MSMYDTQNTHLEEADNEQYVLFKVGNGRYAIASRYINHIQVLGDVTPMIDMPPHCLGMILFDGVSTPIYDLRKVFGVGEYAKELAETMKARVTDHEHWVETLERCVETGEKFTLATNPRECAFGKWFGNFKTDNSYFDIYVRTAEEPHTGIHKTGERVVRLMAEGNLEEARQEVEQMKATHLARMKQILTDLPKKYAETTKTMLIVLTVEQQLKGIAVDAVTNIQYLDDIKSLPGVVDKLERRYIQNLATIEEGGEEQVIQIINAEAIKP